jgi:hypothetical protein
VPAGDVRSARGRRRERQPGAQGGCRRSGSSKLRLDKRAAADPDVADDRRDIVASLLRTITVNYLTEHTGSTCASPDRRSDESSKELPKQERFADCDSVMVANLGGPVRRAWLDAAQHPSRSPQISHVSCCARRAGPRSDSRSCSSCCSTPICRSCATTTRCQGKHKNSFCRRRVRLQHRHRPDGHRRRRRRSCSPHPHLQGHRHLARRRQWRLGW